MKALFIGNLTLDIFENNLRVGGPGFYGGRALSEGFNVEVYALTNVDRYYRGLILGIANIYGIKILELENKGMPMFRISSGKATEFSGTSHKIPNHIIESSIKIIGFDIVTLAPIMNEVSIDAVTIIKSNSQSLLSADIQGFVRSMIDNKIICIWSKDLGEKLMLFDIIHGNVAEYCFTNDERIVLKNIADLSSTCETLFLASLDQRGTYAIHRGEIIYVPSVPVKPVEDVGAGDILLAVTSYYRAIGNPVIEAVVKGVIAASLKVENAYKMRWFDLEHIETIYNEHVRKIEGINL
ncbi:MAG: PfkB family carbohydrate kinase [Ignisphaera sp.]